MIQCNAMTKLSRRKFLCRLPVVAALPAATAAAAQEHGGHAPPTGGEQSAAAHRGSGHRGVVGTVDPAVNGFDPHEMLRDFEEGATSRISGGRTLREFELVAEDK